MECLDTDAKIPNNHPESEEAETYSDCVQGQL